MMFAFGVDQLTTTTNDVVGGVIVLLFAFGPAAAAFTYCTTFLFSSPAYCNVLNIIFGFLVGASTDRYSTAPQLYDGFLSHLLALRLAGFGGTIVVFLLWFLEVGGPRKKQKDLRQ